MTIHQLAAEAAAHWDATPTRLIRNRENGRTMIISTHLVDELNAYIDVAIFMKNGVLERIGDRAALEEKHGSLTNLYLSIYGGKEDEKHVEAAEV